jgi:hypothetical protein
MAELARDSTGLGAGLGKANPAPAVTKSTSPIVVEFLKHFADFLERPLQDDLVQKKLISILEALIHEIGTTGENVYGRPTQIA